MLGDNWESEFEPGFKEAMNRIPPEERQIIINSILRIMDNPYSGEHSLSTQELEPYEGHRVDDVGLSYLRNLLSSGEDARTFGDGLYFRLEITGDLIDLYDCQITTQGGNKLPSAVIFLMPRLRLESAEYQKDQDQYRLIFKGLFNSRFYIHSRGVFTDRGYESS